jgi:aryl-alcohol dehydrogenase-like predicted oxidoreductase
LVAGTNGITLLNMEYRNLGKSGLKISAIGLGCNNFGARIELAATRSVVHKALDLGVTLFDTADIYGNRGLSEAFLGQILGTRRKDIVLATKFGYPMNEEGTRKGASRRYIFSAVEESLRRLDTDWIDLYQIHGPDPSTPLEETLGALNDLVRQGKVLYVGCSNFSAWQLMESLWIADKSRLTPYISCQNEYSLLVRDPEREMIPAMQAYGLGLLPYFPLASGILSGKYKRGTPAPENSRMATWQRLTDKYLTEANWDTLDRLSGFCKRNGHTLLELALSWLLAQPTVSSVIAGATKPEQVEQNVNASGWRPTQDELAEVDRLSKSV